MNQERRRRAAEGQRLRVRGPVVAIGLFLTVSACSSAWRTGPAAPPPVGQREEEPVDGGPAGAAWTNVYRSQNVFTGVWGSSPRDVWVVGHDGEILHWDGTVWRPSRSGTTFILNAIWGAGPADAWVVGIRGTVLHWDGKTWTSLPPVTDEQLFAVWGSSAADVWAVGAHGVSAHWNGHKWSRVTTRTRSFLRGLWGSAADDVWCVGEHGTRLRWTGSAWTDAAAPNVTDDYGGVWGSARDDVWVVGTHIRAHWNGRKWSEERDTGDHLAVAGTARDSAWAVGFHGDIEGWDGARWTPESSGGHNVLFSVWAADRRSVWAAGHGGVLARDLDQQ